MRIVARIGECEVWLADLRGASDEEHERARTLLSDEEHARARSLRSEAARRRFVLARAILRVRLGHALEIPPEQVVLRFGEHGKPEISPSPRDHEDGSARVKQGPPRFNLSHGDGVALLAIHPRDDVGIDVERIAPGRHPWVRLLQRICHPTEAREAMVEARAIGPRAFYERWAGKEAVLKALGHGLRVSPAEVSLRRTPGGALRVWELRGQARLDGRCRLEAVQAPSGFVGAVALVERSP